MASSAAAAGRFFTPLLSVLLLIQLGWLPVSVAGRPCKTLFISTYSFSLRREPLVRPNPNPTRDLIFVNLPGSDPSSSSSSGRFVTIFTTTTATFHNPAFFSGRRGTPGVRSGEALEDRKQQDSIFGLSDLNSLRDRSKDVLSVVVALLFGVGCGALTALTMYMAWSLFSNVGHRRYLEESSDDDEYESDPKKLGYVKIPAPGPSPPAAVPAKA